MSFYGNRFYQLTNAFGKIIIKNNGLGLDTIVEPSVEPQESAAVGLEATYAFDSGNKWIALVGKPEAGVCEIYHSGLDATDQSNTVTPFCVSGEENDDATQLEAGDLIEIPVLAYDKAGHVTGTSETLYFKLPVNATELDLAALNDRMATIEESDTLQNTILEGFSDTYATTEALTGLADRTTTLENISSCIGDQTSLSESEDMTIISAIGNVDNLGSPIADIITSLNAKIGVLELAVDALKARLPASE